MGFREFKVADENGVLIELTPEVQTDILMTFAYSMFKQLIYDKYPPPPGSLIKTPEQGFAHHLGAFAHYYITEHLKKGLDKDESLRH